VNKNAVPNDPRSPFVTSGLRIGSPAVTRRGFTEADCQALTGWMCDIIDVLAAKEDPAAIIAEVKGKVAALCARHPVYQATAQAAAVA